MIIRGIVENNGIYSGYNKMLKSRGLKKFTIQTFFIFTTIYITGVLCTNIVSGQPEGLNQAEKKGNATPDEKTFTEILKGKVLDAKGKPVIGAVVILCDQKSGVPVYKKTYRPFTDEFIKGNQAMDIAYATSDEKGEFTFDNIAAGEYRLVAQSWKDITEFKGIFEKNGKEIELHGIAEHVNVSADSSPNVVLRPLGTGILQVNEDAPNDETLLVVSTSPTRADPILGFAGWGGVFMQNMIGGNRMPKGKTTIYGLPKGKIYLAMFAADSIPGWTEGQVEIKPDTTTVLEYIPFVNSWSNSRHDPPEHLVPVFEELKKLSSTDNTFLLKIFEDYGLEEVYAEGMWKFMAQLGPHLKKEIQLPSGRKTTFGDFMAAVQYIRLRQAVDRREAKRQNQAEIEH
jgi:hypothetical protein